MPTCRCPTGRSWTSLTYPATTGWWATCSWGPARSMRPCPSRAHGQAGGGPRLAVDRVFTVRGRGLVVTGTLRGGRIARGDALRLEPGGRSVRVREVQGHGGAVGGGGGALTWAGGERDEVAGGMVLCNGPAVRATDRLLVALRPVPGGRPPADGTELRVHLGTDEGLSRGRLGGGAARRGA